ncbi:MAG: DedA family protein [Ktedonobacteraceae bacterium]
MNVFFLSALQHYGYPALWVIVFVAAAGAPISGSLLLFAAGAFAAFGDFNLAILFLVALSAAVMGDNLGYYIGRRVGSPLLAWFARQKRFRMFTSQTLERSRIYFRRRAGWAIFLTRFLIVVLGGAINFLAGVEKYPYRKFLFWDVSGQMLCAVITLGLGYISAESWEEVASLFGAFSSLLLALLVAVAIGGVLIGKLRQRKRARAIEAEVNNALQTQQTVSKVGQDTGPMPASE